MTRKIIQVVETIWDVKGYEPELITTVLCDDGTLWLWDFNKHEWKLLPNVSQLSKDVKFFRDKGY